MQIWSIYLICRITELQNSHLVAHMCVYLVLTKTMEILHKTKLLGVGLFLFLFTLLHFWGVTLINSIVQVSGVQF